MFFSPENTAAQSVLQSNLYGGGDYLHCEMVDVKREQLKLASKKINQVELS
jgi:hypothetical protein